MWFKLWGKLVNRYRYRNNNIVRICRKKFFKIIIINILKDDMKILREMEIIKKI